MYQDCGDTNKIIALKYFDTQPTTLSIPQNISLSVVFEIVEGFTEKLQVRSKLEAIRKIMFLFKDKCVYFKKTAFYWVRALAMYC